MMDSFDKQISEISASSPGEVHRFLKRGNISRIRLSWDISSDQFFNLATECLSYGEVKIERDSNGFFIEQSH